MGKRLSEQELESAVKIYINQNISAEDVGKMFGISERPILRKVKELGLSKNRSEAQEKLRIINKDEYKNIVLMYQNEPNYSKIAKKYNTTKNTIKKILKQQGIKILNSSDKSIIQDTEKQEIIKRYLNGEPTTSICKDFNVSCGTISYYLKLAGFKIKRRTLIDFLSEEEKNEIIDMYLSGTLVKEIQKKYKVSNQILRNFLKSYGIELRSAGEAYLFINNKNNSYGISGYYKNFYFRSLLELCFIAKTLTRKYKNDQWESGETKNNRIKYKDFDNNEKWYYPDFVIKNKIVVECKPRYLWEDDINKIKFQAARQYCKLNNKKFIIVDQKVDLEFISILYNNKELTLSEKQEKRLRNKINKYIK